MFRTAAVVLGAALLTAAVAAAPLGGALSPLEMTAGLRRLTFSVNPNLLAGVHLEAVETWTPAGEGARPESERDAVHFYHAVPIEMQQSEDGRRLGAGAMRDQQKQARQLESLIDKAVAGAVGGEDGRLLNIGGNIWTLDRFQAHFTWSGERGPMVAGRPTYVLRFMPAAGVHPHSRVARLLSRTAGEVETDAQTGQILAGSFHSLGAVKFGAGILADISFMEGHFTLQPVTTPQGECWVLHTVEVHLRSRELWSRHNGTETMTYTVVPASRS